MYKPITTSPRRQLKMAPIATDDNVLEQLAASCARIEDGLRAIRELLERVAVVADRDPLPAPIED